MRTSILLDDVTAIIAKKVATQENRNFSNLCEVALTQYCETRQKPEAHAEIIAYANTLGATRALSALKRAARTKRTAA